MMKKIKLIIILIFLFYPLKLHALIEVDITRGNLNPLPIAVSPLSSDNKSASALNKKLNIENVGSEISKVVENNLRTTGLFNPLNKDAFLQEAHDLFSKHDANDLLGMLGTWQRADLGKHSRFNDDFAAALSSIRAKAIIMPCATDLYFPSQDSEIEVAQMPNAELRVIPSEIGHLAGLPRMDREADKFIENALSELLR